MLRDGWAPSVRTWWIDSMTRGTPHADRACRELHHADPVPGGPGDGDRLFTVVIGIGFVARSRVKSSMDFVLSGRSVPAWIPGPAFISANLGATEILGMAANGARIGISTLHHYPIGAVPAMVFLGLVMSGTARPPCSARWRWPAASSSPSRSSDRKASTT